MGKKFIGLIGLCLLGGCTTATPMTLSDGTQGYDIECGGLLQTMGDCLKKAGVVCPNGYKPVGSDEESNPYTFAVNPGPDYATQYNTVPIINRELVVECE